MLSCLLVGTIVYRQFNTVEVSLPTSSPFTRYLSSTQYFQVKADVEVVEEKITFSEMKFEEEKKVVVAKAQPKAEKNKETIKPIKTEEVQISVYTLPFDESIEVKPVYHGSELKGNLIALYKEFRFDDSVMVAEDAVKTDSVSTIAAVTQSPNDTDAEPVFFEYETGKKDIPESKKVTEVLLPTAEMKNETPVSPSEEIEFFDLVSDKKEESPSTPVTLPSSIVSPRKTTQPTTWTVAEKKKGKSTHSSNAVTESAKPAQETKPENSMAFIGGSGLTIQAIGSDLKGARKLNGFEVRFMDDYSEILDDYGSGQINFAYSLSEDQVTRAARVLKRGFTPTNTDLILETSGAQTTLPLIDEDTFNELLRPYESSGPMGALLLELDDETQLAQVDVPFVKVMHFNDRLEESSEEEARYQLFVGIRAGNALITYHHRRGHTVNKIVSIQNHELTFDNNLYVSAEEKKISLWEENLLSKEKKPLVMATSSFKRFVTGKTGKKISQNAYHFRFPEDKFAGRRYFELNHLSEPVFVGTKTNMKLEIPSENFMRYVLSRLDNSGLTNRCIIQVNLKKMIRSADVGSESVEDSLLTSVQTLDADGQFYDTPSDQTQKIIVMGESHAPAEVSPDGKINMKLQYVDGTTEYLSSYCSPNTYVVEQL